MGKILLQTLGKEALKYFEDHPEELAELFHDGIDWAVKALSDHLKKKKKDQNVQ